MNLRDLEYQYSLPMGASLEEAQRQYEFLKGVVKKEKLWFTNFRKANPKTKMKERLVAFAKERGIDALIGCTGAVETELQEAFKVLV